MADLQEEGRMECEDNIHDWEHSSWGVIIGVSKCKKCGKVAKEEDFNKTDRIYISEDEYNVYRRS